MITATFVQLVLKARSHPGS